MSGRRREKWLILKDGSCELDTNRLVIIPESTCHLEQSGWLGVGSGESQARRVVMIQYSSDCRLSELEGTENPSFYDITAGRLSSMYVHTSREG